jgi:hypothetical protein
MRDSTTGPTNPRGHVHHWVIEEVQGPTSDGQCRHCGALRTFRNWPAEEVLQRAQYVAA